MEKFKIMFAPRNLIGSRRKEEYWIEVKEFPGEYSQAETQKILNENERIEKHYGIFEVDADDYGGELVGVLVKE